MTRSSALKKKVVIKESTSKPRSLLPTFLRATQDDFDDVCDDMIGSAAVTSKRHSTNSATKQNRHDDSANQSEKKVRWQQDQGQNVDIVKTEVRPRSAFTSLQKSKEVRKRQSFGSSVKQTTVTSASSTLPFKEKKTNTTSSVVARASKAEVPTAQKLSSSKEAKKRVSSGMLPQERLSKVSYSTLPLKKKKTNIASLVVTRPPKADIPTEQVLSTSKDAKMRPSSHQSSGLLPLVRYSKIDSSTLPLKEKKANISSSVVARSSKAVATTAQVLSTSKEAKKRASSRQASEMLSQERSSQVRRRKRSLSGATSGAAKPSLCDYDEVDYDFNFTK
jgi:hypothetical protein